MLCLLNHPLHKVPALTARPGLPVEARHPNYVMLGRIIPGENFSRILTHTINIYRVRHIFFGIWLPLFAIENVIRADININGINLIGNPCNIQSTNCIHGKGFFGIKLCIINPNVSSSINKDIWLNFF
ncbi:127aa long hypothetical protein [Pyrococcus horikoshii OT3]|uniref:Uncharacterized protein n=1 Tax=Pyrococcus horikoshii (strain ATCC 700860 / DSM 12428 / JCM 9974 / NBRC 100139 / OT-3) TaxID=70601 RepID=O58155_PYRHO|nr:127aa long hypothetical protein [Pyrococcus horikoshii OT3]